LACRKWFPSEGIVQKQILDWLSYKRSKYKFWRNNTIGVWDQARGVYRKNKSKYHENGIGDIIVIVAPHGIHVEIEVKSKYGVQSDNQKQHQKDIEAVGSLYCLAYSVEDVALFFQKHGL